MTRLTACFALLACLPACEPAAVKEAKSAESRYDLIQKTGTLAEACETAKQVRDAYLEALDNHSYELWSAIARTQCLAAEQDGGSMPADLKTRQEIQQKAADMELDAASAALEATGNAVESASDSTTDPGEGAEDEYAGE